MNTLEKLNSMKETYATEAQTVIDDLIARYTKALAKETILQHVVIVDMVEDFKKEVENINTKLLTEDSKTLDAHLRDRLLDKREIYKHLIACFDISGEKKEIEEYVARQK